jgi:hypothetical protein
MVTLRPHDVLAVRPSPGAELLRWQWKDKTGAAQLLSDATLTMLNADYNLGARDSQA